MTDQPNANMARAAKLARTLNRDLQELWAMLGKPKDSPSYNNEIPFLNLVDEVSSIACALEAKTDGRPQPIDRSSIVGSAEEKKRFKEWANCHSPGYEDKASIGTVDLTKEQLIDLRNWIDSVLKWHEEKGVESEGGNLRSR